MTQPALVSLCVTTTTALTPPSPIDNSLLITADATQVKLHCYKNSSTLLPCNITTSKLSATNPSGSFLWSPISYAVTYPFHRLGYPATRVYHTYDSERGTLYLRDEYARTLQASLWPGTDGGSLFYDLATERWMPQISFSRQTNGDYLFLKKVHLWGGTNVSLCKRTNFGGTYAEGDVIYDADYNMYIATTTGTYNGQGGFWRKLTSVSATPPV